MASRRKDRQTDFGFFLWFTVLLSMRLTRQGSTGKLDQAVTGRKEWVGNWWKSWAEMIRILSELLEAVKVGWYWRSFLVPYLNFILKEADWTWISLNLLLITRWRHFKYNYILHFKTLNLVLFSSQSTKPVGSGIFQVQPQSVHSKD